MTTDGLSVKGVALVIANVCKEVLPFFLRAFCRSLATARANLPLHWVYIARGHEDHTASLGDQVPPRHGLGRTTGTNGRGLGGTKVCCTRSQFTHPAQSHCSAVHATHAAHAAMSRELKQLETRSLASIELFDANMSDRERRKMRAVMARMGVLPPPVSGA